MYNHRITSIYQTIKFRKMVTLKTILAAILIAPAVTSFAGDCNPLSGEFKIGKGESDYSSISSAVAALKCGGVSGPVTFLIADGTYSEKIDITAISGVSAANTVVFESEKGNNIDVVIASTSPDASYTLNLNGTSYVSFEN